MAITVNFEELAGSPNEQYTDTGFTATRQIKCSWGGRHKLAKQLKKGFGAAYPYNIAAHVTGVAIAPFHAEGLKESIDARKAVYDDAMLTVTYKTPDGYSGVDSDDEKELVSEEIEHTTEFITLPGRRLWWDAERQNPLGDDVNPGMLIQGMNWVYTIYQKNSLPPQYKSLIGKVNSDQIKSLTTGFVFEPETLLFNPPRLQRVITSEGIKAWNVSLVFSHRETKWNKFYNIKTNTFEEIYGKSTATPHKIYIPAPFKSTLQLR